MHLTVIIATLSRLTTASLLVERIKELLPDLEIEFIVVTPAAGTQPTSNKLVRYVMDAGHGVYMAYNAALRFAVGEYVWFIGDDDYPLDAAMSMSGILQKGAVDLIVAPVLFSSGKAYRPTRILLLLHFLNWCQQGVIYRRRTLLRYKFHNRLTVQADQYVNILLRSDPTVTKTFLIAPICVFGVNGVSGRLRDDGYRSLRRALARRTLSSGAFLIFLLLMLIEPIIKRVITIR